MSSVFLCNNIMPCLYTYMVYLHMQHLYSYYDTPFYLIRVHVNCKDCVLVQGSIYGIHLRYLLIFRHATRLPAIKGNLHLFLNIEFFSLLVFLPPFPHSNSKFFSKAIFLQIIIKIHNKTEKRKQYLPIPATI